jgi:protein TonB
LAHWLLFVLMATIPLLYYDEVPDQGALRAFFATPLDLQPPPPPPPPPAAGVRRIVKAAPAVRTDMTRSFVAPIEVPDEIRPDESLDLGLPGGVLGGVEGGVPGGVVGGVVGGLPLSPTITPPERAPVRVGGHIKAPVKVTHVPPVYPTLAAAARVQGVVIVECTISPNGRVSNVKVLRSVPLLDRAAVGAVKQWVYTPTLLNGVPVPVIMTVSVTFELT